ncbi:MAG: hypothetical protein NWR72_18395 [Bacteroidia bacterium]|nr:hypothetical protein [Bacteroidia bacterium]
MNKASTFFYQKSSLILVLVLTVATFGYLFFVMMEVAAGFEVPNDSNKSLGTSFGFSYDAVVQFLSIRTPEMIARYQAFNAIWDNLFALLYGLMYVAWVSYLLKPFQAKFKMLNLLPLVQVVFDWLENYELASIARAFLAGESISTTAVELASIFSMVKWVASMLVFAIIILGIGMRIRALIKKKPSGE